MFAEVGIRVVAAAQVEHIVTAAEVWNDEVAVEVGSTFPVASDGRIETVEGFVFSY